MKILALQYDIVWGRPDENMRRLDALLPASAAAEEPALIVLPEMFTTGFMSVPAEAADAPLADGSSPATDWIRRAAARTGAALCGSVATKTDDGRFCNRLWFVRPDGSADYYDKVHLFGYGGETEHYRAGRRRVVAEYGGVRFLLQVCYDLRFPVFARNRGDYDAIIYVASWPASRIGAWQTLLRARAIENQCFVAGINRTGADPACRYSGASAIIGPKGETLAEADGADEQWINARLDMAALDAFRRKFPVLADADDFRLG